MEKKKEPQKSGTKAPASKEKFTASTNGTSIRSRTAKWFECKVRYQKVVEDGTNKNVTELYVVDALSFAEAEARIIDELSVNVSGELKVTNITPAPYGEIFFSGMSDDELWYKARLAFITIDEKTNKEKHSYFTYLVQAKYLDRAKRYVDEVMGSTMIDYELKGVVETKILDVFEHKGKEQKKKSDK